MYTDQLYEMSEKCKKRPLFCFAVQYFSCGFVRVLSLGNACSQASQLCCNIFFSTHCSQSAYFWADRQPSSTYNKDKSPPYFLQSSFFTSLQSSSWKLPWISAKDKLKQKMWILYGVKQLNFFRLTVTVISYEQNPAHDLWQIVLDKFQ